MIGENIKLGKRVKIGQNSIIKKNVVIGDDVLIFPHVYVGENTKIGDKTIVQYGAFIEHDCNIGKHTRIGTHAVLRRETNIGDHSIFGTLTASEGKNWIGNHVLIHSQCHLTTGIIIEDYVFIAPLFVGANDRKMVHERRNIEEFVPNAPHIKFGSRLAVSVTVLPRVVIGRESVIGASALVTKDIPDFSVAYGSPAKVVRTIEEKMRLPAKYYRAFRRRISEKKLMETIEKILNN